jgi:transcriptional regulator with XRE-family HTH domain
MTEKTIHEGRNVKRIREMLGIKQDALAMELGDDWNQQRISLLEGKESIDPKVLDEVAKALKVPVEAIKNFDEERAVTIISNNFHDNASIFQFNPIEKIIELYERLLKDKEVMIEEMKKMMSK